MLSKKLSQFNLHSPRVFGGLILILFLVGAMVRLTPLLDETRMFKSITEDGYLMMTIARNMGLGFGMSTSLGQLPTNGTQPLTTGLWAAGFWLFNGDKTLGAMWVIWAQFIIASLAAFLLWLAGKQILHSHRSASTVAALAAATWYASPVTLKHTMNGLETGLYALCVIGITLFFSIAAVHTWRLWRYAVVGVLLGLTFWVRNDAVFFIFAACLTHILRGSWSWEVLRERILQVFVMGATSVIIAIPWLINNMVNFGHLMPVSGQSESMIAAISESALLVPAISMEYMLAFLPIQGYGLTADKNLAIGAMLLIFLAFGLVLWHWRQFHAPERRLVMIAGIFGLCLVIFYGIFFNVPHFIGRYLFPISPFFVLLWAAVVVGAWHHLEQSQLRILLPAVAVSFAGYIMLSHAQAYWGNNQYYLGSQHLHWQVVEWTQKNVPETVWVGALQSGTLGYFHDRTINLDGKVNPEALVARQTNKIGDYIQQKNIEYIVDWPISEMWMGGKEVFANAKMRRRFSDNSENLAVWQRIH
ncbi:MAG: glycosyltransferase family 39 protein [Thiotrichaceae bacterium]|nr:glycosyltransferase family 39 protein [Thiotrichaceae bacterium]